MYRIPTTLRKLHLPFSSVAQRLLIACAMLAVLLLGVSCCAPIGVGKRDATPSVSGASSMPIKAATATAFRPTPTPVPQVPRGILWTRDTSRAAAAAKDGFSALYVDDTVAMVTPEGYIVGIDLPSGEQLWQWEDKGVIAGIEPSTVYVIRADKRLYALDLRTGQQKWRVVFDVDSFTTIKVGFIICRQTVHLPFDHVSFGTTYNPSVTLDKKTGEILWYASGDNPVQEATEHTLLTKDRWQGIWHGVDAASGTVLWEVKCGPAVRLDSILVHGTYERPLASLDVNSGDQRWETTRQAPRDILAVNSDRVYYTVADTPDSAYTSIRMVVLDQQTGRELWTLPDLGTTAGVFVGEADGIAIVEHDNKGFTYGFDATSGGLLWLNDDMRMNRLVGVCGSTIVGAYNSPSGNVRPLILGIDPGSGKRKWRIEPSNVSHKTIIVGDKVVYGDGANIVLVDPDTGQSVSTIALPDKPRSISQAGGLLYVVTQSSKVVVVRP